jgi:hypothetical protein
MIINNTISEAMYMQVLFMKKSHELPSQRKEDITLF